MYASETNLAASAKSITKPYLAKNSSQGESSSFDNVINVEDDFVFNAEDEDEEYENGKRSSTVKDVLSALLSSFADSSGSCGKLSYHTAQIFPDNSPLYIEQRVLRI